MARRASPTLIGFFVLGGIAIVVGALLLLGGREWVTPRVTCVMAFDGSVAGLTTGAPVSYRGVPVGTVTNVTLSHGSDRVIVFARLHRSRIPGAPRDVAQVRRSVEEAVQHGLRAQLQLESLITGQLYVGLDWYGGTTVQLTGVEKDTCEIPTIPSRLAQVQDHLMKITQQLADTDLTQAVAALTRTLDEVGRLVTSPELSRTIVSADGTLREAKLLLSDLRVQIGPAVGSLERTLDRAQETIGEVGHDVRRLVADVDAQVEPLAANVGATSDSARALMQDVRTTLGGLDERIGTTLDRTQQTIDEVGQDVRRLVADIDAQVEPLAANVGATSDSARALAEDARRTVRRLEEQVGAAMMALRQASDATGDAMRKAETAFGKVDATLDGSSPLGYQLGDALEQLARTAASLRTLTEEIDRQPNVLLFGRRGASHR